jgi:hypothetical protein
VFQDILKESNLKMTRAFIRALGMMTHESSRDLLRQLAKNPSNPIVQKEAKRELIRRRIPQ